ncbi:MAG: NAD(P)H-dependent oxidoreductase subunit E [Nitrosopumilus sp.]
MKHSEQELSKVDQIIDSYDNNKEALIQILLDTQNEYRWLSRTIVTRVSEKLGITLNHIYNITTFYKHFSLLPKGRHTITVCLGTACHVRGAVNLLDRVSNYLGVRPEQTTADEKFSLSTVNCLGCCALGPVMVVDKEYHSKPTTKEIKQITDAFK